MKPEVRRAHPSREFLTSEGCFILEVANDDGDQAVSIARARVPPGATTEWHQLLGTEERYVIVSGRGRVELSGLPATDVEPGDVVRIPSETAQRVANTGSDDLVFFCVCTPRFSRACYVAIPDTESNY